MVVSSTDDSNNSTYSNIINRAGSGKCMPEWKYFLQSHRL